jgi:hypothetical protein
MTGRDELKFCSSNLENNWEPGIFIVRIADGSDSRAKPATVSWSKQAIPPKAPETVTGCNRPKD